MANPAHERHHLSHEEYFALERAEHWRYEYLAGEVFAMTGGSIVHARLAGNALITLASRTRGSPCRALGADAKLYIASHDKYCYPDLTLLCAEGRESRLYVEGPALVAEVLSPSTSAYDRGLKFEHYRAIPELRYYLLLDQDRPHVELFERQEGGSWRLSEASGPEGEIALPALGLTLPLAELYRDVDFANAESEEEPADAR